MTEIDVVIADITTFPADAIVNAANVSLKGGGGVDGAIHRAAGEALDIACSLFGGCPTGETRTTIAFNIKTAKFIIHTPGPRFSEARAEECDALLEACYRNSLRAAEEHDCKSVAFPSISTGIYRFPLDRAAAICYISRDRFNHVFKEATGFSPNVYLTKLRVERAKQLLRDEGMNVRECAESVGYRDTNYFCRVFRKENGISPGEYARNKK